MQNLSLKIGNYNFSFAGKCNLSVSQKTEKKPKLPVLMTDVFQANTELSEEEKKIFRLRTVDCLYINEIEEAFAEYFPVLYFKNKITKEDAGKIPDVEKTRANAVVSRNIAYMQEVRIAEKMAEALKESLDEKYGKNNYNVLGIGRSPSPITTILNLNDVKSTSVPFSHNMRIGKERVPFDDYDKVLDWKEYLQRFGFDEKTLTDKNKTTIITDFSFSGGTLSNFKKILDKIYPDNNVQAVDIISLCKQIPKDIQQKKGLDNSDFRIFASSMEECDYKFSFCTCKHLDTLEDYKKFDPKNDRWPLLSKIIVADYLAKKGQVK